MNAKCYHTIANLTPLAVILGALSAFAAQDVREEFHQNYPLNKAGKIFLENVNGNVHVVTWDRDEGKLALSASKRSTPSRENPGTTPPAWTTP